MIELSFFIGIVFFIFSVYWMLQMLKLTKQNRIINSMLLKAILKYCESQGINIDIEKIQKEVEASV